MVSVETIRRIVRRDTWAWLVDGIQAPVEGSPEEAAAIAASKARFLADLAALQEQGRSGDKLLDELKGEQGGDAKAGADGNSSGS